MDANDTSALVSLHLIALLVWWIARRLAPPVQMDERGDDHREVPPVDRHVHYSCAPTGEDRVLVGVRHPTPPETKEWVQAPGAEAKHWTRVMAEDAMKRSKAEPRDWDGYFSTLAIWRQLALKLSDCAD